MFNKTRLTEILEDYKKDFVPKTWGNEKYKWVAVKTFQDNWDINAPDFAEMLERALSKTGNLLNSRMNYPGKMIQDFTRVNPDEVRTMFKELYNESVEITSRIAKFKEKSENIFKEYLKKVKGYNHHYQKENAITTYLWLRFPDRYYIYKLSVLQEVALKLGFDYNFPQGAYHENTQNFIKLYDELCEFIGKDDELINCLKSQLTEDCYPDPQLRTLTIDIGYYISTHYRDKKAASDEEWHATDYSPNISTEQWIGLLEDPHVFTPNGLKIVSRFKDFGGQATCKQLSDKYGETPNFYNSGSVGLARRVAEATNCPLRKADNGHDELWPVLYTGKIAGNNVKGDYIWKLRDELSEALDSIEITDEKINGQPTDENSRKYWWLNANPKVWSFSDLKVGEIQFYTLYNESGHKRRVFQNFVDAKVGDIIIGYESNPTKKIVAICKVSAAQDGEKIYFEKIETLSSPIDYATLKDCPELRNMEYFANPNGSFFKLTAEEYDFIMDVIREENPKQPMDKSVEKYDKGDFLNEVYMTESEYDKLVNVLKNKKNIILQGAPGVGKTFAAKRLAYSIMGEKDESRVEFVQFHQNYSYEDFVMGYKPADEGFKLKNGVFYNFCVKASNSPEEKFFFIIDEINRGNLSKIFGELLMLIENTHRGDKTSMTYSDVRFSVPKNLYIIGMMNTADRSLAMIDYALRRRFSFYEMRPAFDSDGFRKFQAKLNNDTFNRLIDSIKRLNDEIEKDSSLGRGFCIGHSYFCDKENYTIEDMRAVVDYEIIPMLEEYWFDDSGKVDNWRNTLQNIVK